MTDLADMTTEALIASGTAMLVSLASHHESHYHHCTPACEAARMGVELARRLQAAEAIVALQREQLGAMPRLPGRDSAYVESIRDRAERAQGSADHRALVIGDMTRKLQVAEKRLEMAMRVVEAAEALHPMFQSYSSALGKALTALRASAPGKAPT